MKKGKIYGYARVSTTGQATNGNSLEEQVKELRDGGATEIVTEHYTGKTTDRPAFTELCNKLQDGDTLIVTKLDRFARSVQQGLTMIQTLIDRGVIVNVLNMGVLDNDSPISKMMMTMFLAFAEFERAMIVERTQAGKAIAKTKDGYHEGRPRMEQDKGKKLLLETAIQKIKAGEWSYRVASKETGISLSTIQRRMKEL